MDQPIASLIVPIGGASNAFVVLRPAGPQPLGAPATIAVTNAAGLLVG